MATITLISGPPGCGKTTVSNLVARRFPKCTLIPVDQLREMMVTGIFEPGADLTGVEDEFHNQFQMARSTAIHMAELYSKNQVDVIIDDVSFPHMFAEHYRPLTTHPNFRRILLLPRLDAQLERIKTRGGRWDEALVNYIPGMYEYLEPMPKDGWTVLDSSDWTVDRTVDEIIARMSS